MQSDVIIGSDVFINLTFQIIQVQIALSPDGFIFATLKEFLPPAKNKSVTVEFDFVPTGGGSTAGCSGAYGDGIVMVLSNADTTPAPGG